MTTEEKKKEVLTKGMQDLDRLLEKGNRLEHAARFQKLLADLEILEALGNLDE